MLIYAEHITPRLRYIADFFFGECIVTSSPVAFHAADVPKINYSHKRFSQAELHIVPNGLLNETTIRSQPIILSQWNALPVFFTTKGDIPFDIFSAAFYLLSRYEEYLPHPKDSYGRFAHTASIAFKHGFLDKPLVNAWMQQLNKLLSETFIGYLIPRQSFRFIPSYDIDIAFAGGRGWLRTMLMKLKGKQTTINGKDILDVYDWLNALHQQYQLSPVYFFLLARYRGKYDKNLSPKSARLRRLIRDTAASYDTGIHPSWQSYDNDRALNEEIGSLQKISGKNITASRQHYIRFTLPYTYRQLIDAGITEEYSMGYGSINGFRASCATPFYWYDLMNEQSTALRLHPFCFMEANACFEQHLTAEEAADELQYYYNVVQDVNGELITIFHNHFLTEEDQWQPWRKMYEQFLQKNFGG